MKMEKRKKKSTIDPVAWQKENEIRAGFFLSFFRGP